MKLIKVTFTAISGGNRGFRLSVAMYNLEEKIFHNLRRKIFRHQIYFIERDEKENFGNAIETKTQFIQCHYF